MLGGCKVESINQSRSDLKFIKQKTWPSLKIFGLKLLLLGQCFDILKLTTQMCFWTYRRLSLFYPYIPKPAGVSLIAFTDKNIVIENGKKKHLVKNHFRYTYSGGHIQLYKRTSSCWYFFISYLNFKEFYENL